MSDLRDDDPERAAAEKLAAMTDEEMIVLYVSALAEAYQMRFAGLGWDLEAVAVIAIDAQGRSSLVLQGARTANVLSVIAASLPRFAEIEMMPIGGGRVQ